MQDFGSVTELRLVLATEGDHTCARLAVKVSGGPNSGWRTLMTGPVATLCQPSLPLATQARDLLRDVIAAGYAARRIAGNR